MPEAFGMPVFIRWPRSGASSPTTAVSLEAAGFGDFFFLTAPVDESTKGSALVLVLEGERDFLRRTVVVGMDDSVSDVLRRVTSALERLVRPEASRLKGKRFIIFCLASASPKAKLVTEDTCESTGTHCAIDY